ncbi:MAG: OmpA family protein [Desulfobacterales bacterium]|nr:OmpA family protein [Desulfobacterales bacterium]
MNLLDDIQSPILEEGAPAWVVTFGDLMSLLLCFFVLLLSFSEMDKAKYKEVSGSLAKAFGVQRKIKAFEAPKGIKMISRDFDQELIPARPREEFIAMQQREKIGMALKKEVETRFRDLQDLIQVEVGEKEVTIRLMGETAFDSGKADIKAQMVPLLLKIGSVLADGKGEVIIAGHTDNVPVHGGPYGSNLKLSIARAATVAEFLLAKSAIPASRVSTMGFGKYRPIETNDTDEGRKRNRRVEIILQAPESPKPQKSDISDPIRGNGPIVKNPVFQ